MGISVKRLTMTCNDEKCRGFETCLVTGWVYGSTQFVSHDSEDVCLSLNIFLAYITALQTNQASAPTI